MIAYYNVALGMRGIPPFKVHPMLPQIMFPRGAVGLGKHNIEDEQGNGVGTNPDYVKLQREMY